MNGLEWTDRIEAEATALVIGMVTVFVVAVTVL